MKLNSLLTTVTLCIAYASSCLAFPALANMKPEELAALTKRFAEMPQERQLQIPTVGRKQIPDAVHPFIAPSATAQRGPCPGTNIMANYGYINRK